MRPLAIILSILIASNLLAADLPSKTDVSLHQEANRALERGLAYLLQSQNATNGSWRDHPAITALAVTAFLRSGSELTKPQRQAVDRGLEYIMTNVKTNGAIFGGGETDKYPNYSTAICLMALASTKDAKYAQTIRNARNFLLELQSDEGEQIGPKDPSYGGLGYGRRGRPDLSNSSWSYEALKLTESMAEDSPHTANDLHWKKAIAFATRCQNLPKINEQAWASKTTDDDLGGFVYMPGFSFVNEEEKENMDGPLQSHGSISYAGLKSYIYADLKKNDRRVKAVVDWLARHYTLDENPGMGQQGLYYYLHLMTKALTAYGEDTFKTADGKDHDWRYELIKKFVQLQKDDGRWENANNRFWEADPVLVTSYSVLALEILQQRKYL